MSHAKQIAKNTSYFTIANVLQKIIAFFYFAYIGRLIGPDNLGQYTFALSFTTIFSIFVDIGFEKVLIRESAKKLERAQDYFSNVLGIKIPLAALSILFIFLIAHFQNYPMLTRQLIYIAAFLMALDSFNLSMECVLRGHQNLKYESISVVVCQLITLVVGVGGILVLHDIRILIIALFAGSLFRFGYAMYALISRYKIYPKIKYEKDTIKFLIKTAIPFAIAGIFLKVYSYADTILLYNLCDSKAVGLYSLPYRATTAFQFIPMAFTAALLPALSHFYVSSRDLLRKAFEKAIFYLTIISIPISFGTIALSREIILKFFGSAYEPSIIALQILMCNLIFLFLDFPAGTLLNACDREKVNTVVMGIAMILNIVSNLILIPWISYKGASISMIVSTLFLAITRLSYSYKITKFDVKGMFIKIFKTLAAGLIMFFAVIYIKPYLNLYLTVFVGALVYSAALYLFGGIKKRDIIVIYEALRHKV